MKLIKRALALSLLATASLCWGQTSFNLNDSPCAIQGSNYLFCSQLGVVTIDGTEYGLSAVTQIANLYLYPATGAIQSGSVSFENLSTGIYTEATPNSTSTYQNYVLTDNFNGGFNGTLTFTLQRRLACGRYGCHPAYYAHNVTLTIQDGPSADGGPIPLCPPRRSRLRQMRPAISAEGSLARGAI